MNSQERFLQAQGIYQAGLEKVRTTPAPEGQKFPCGSRVLTVGCEATVLYTYAHAYWGENVKDYCLDVDGYGVSAWHHESLLTAITSPPEPSRPFGDT